MDGGRGEGEREGGEEQKEKVSGREGSGRDVQDVETEEIEWGCDVLNGQEISYVGCQSCISQVLQTMSYRMLWCRDTYSQPLDCNWMSSKNSLTFATSNPIQIVIRYQMVLVIYNVCVIQMYSMAAIYHLGDMKVYACIVLAMSSSRDCRVNSTLPSLTYYNVHVPRCR